MDRQYSEELLEFIEKSPSCFHAVCTMKGMLEKAGYKELKENEIWTIIQGGRYYVTRNGSSLIAFQIPKGGFAGFQIVASHSDSPAFKVKENAEMIVDQVYTKLNVEKYGSMLCAPWFDRPLSVAGRLVVRNGNRMETCLVDVGRDLLMMPNLAIHMDRQANEGHAYNVQKEMLPILGDGKMQGGFMDLIAEAAGVRTEQIKGSDLFVYNRQKGTLWGAQEEYVSAPRLDDLQCAFASLKGFLQAEPKQAVSVYCAFDNEEVGSTTRQGAASTFLKGVLRRINGAFKRNEEQFLTALASSFMISADNAHALHPNYTEKADPTNRPVMNGGIVIKYSANQKYTTDAVSAGILKIFCEKAGVPYQTFANRSDMVGGSTLGNLSGTQVSVSTVDIGLAQLAMHSPYESCGVKDTAYLVRLAKTFYESAVIQTEDGQYEMI